MSIAPHPLKPWRIHARRLGGMASVALLPLLMLQLGTLWLIRTGAEVEVPEFLAAPLRSRLESAGIVCDWSSARISASGRIELTDASVGSSSARDSVFEAGRLSVVLSPVDLFFFQRVTPVRLWLDRGRLICPASLSPTARREIALDRIRASLHREGGRLIIDTLQANYSGVPIVAHGRVLPTGAQAPSSAAPSPPSSSVHPLRAPGIAAARLVSLRPWVARLSGASLELSGEDDGAQTRLRLTGLADEFHLAEAGVSAERLRLDFGLSWDGSGPHPRDVAVFTVGSLAVDRGASGSVPAVRFNCGAAKLRTGFGPHWELPSSARITVYRPEVNGVPLDRLDVFGSMAGGGRLNLDVHAGWRREYARMSGVIDPQDGTLNAAFSLRAYQREILAHPAAPHPDSIPVELRELRIPGAVNAAGRIVLGSGWKFVSADVIAETGALHLPHVDVLSAGVTAHVTPEKLIISEIRAESDTQRVTASVETGYHATSPYRILVRANAYPEQVRPYVGKWWDRIWADLALTPGHPAFIDLDVSGQWDGLPYEHIFASFAAEKLSYRKQVFDHVSVRLLEEPEPVHRISIFDMRMRNDDGTHARGRLEWRYAGAEHNRESCRFHFAGRLTKDVGVQLAGDEVVEALADLKAPGQAEGEVIGLYHGVMSATPGRDQLEVRVKSEGPFEAWKLPGEAFSGVVTLDGQRLEIRDAVARYAGGSVTGRAWLNLCEPAYRLTFDAEFKDCERNAFFTGIARMKSESPSAPKPSPTKAATSEKPQELAFLSGDIHARVILSDMATFDGRGAGVMRAPGLASLPVLGAFSRGLESMGVEAATYRFDKVDGQYFIRDGAVWFPDLKVRGADALLDVRGKYIIGPGDIAFRAMLVPNKADSIPMLDWAKNLITSSAKLFPVDVRGTFDEPKWTVDPTPSAMVTKKRNDSLGLPPPPPPDDGQW